MPAARKSLLRRTLSPEERYPAVEYTAEQMEAANRLLPYLRLAVSRCWEVGWSWIYPDGSAREIVTYPCYGSMQNKSFHERSKPAPVLFCTYRLTGATIRLGAEMDFELARPFLQWLLNDSLYARVFVTKDPWAAWEKGIICHMNWPAVFVLQACAIARYPKELPDIVRWWYRLAKVIDKHAALIFAHHLRDDDHQPQQFYIHCDMKVTNTFFDPGQIGVQELTRMVNGDLSCLKASPFAEAPGPYREFTRIFRKSGVVGRDRDFVKDGPGLVFAGSRSTKRKTWLGDAYEVSVFDMDNLENDAKRFFEDNYAGKNYA